MAIQYLGKAHDDIQWRAYLMADILNECRLLLVGLFYQVRGPCQFFITLLGLPSGIAHAAHVEVERLEHGGKTVLQPSHCIFTAAARYMHLHIT